MVNNPSPRRIFYFLLETWQQEWSQCTATKLDQLKPVLAEWTTSTQANHKLKKSWLVFGLATQYSYIATFTLSNRPFDVKSAALDWMSLIS